MAIEITIEGYDSFDQIALGGMAAVYKARKISIDKVVAIKVLFPYLASDSSFIERFQREAKSAAKVQHENIANVIDFGESGGCYYIVMEFYEGLTIAELLQQQARLPLDIAVSVLLDVCLGLEAAHAKDIVHRDIKPANIIYTRQGGIKIADFGLAKKSDTMTVVTQPGKVIGTPAYMSPEQAAGESVGPQSDIFSLGVVAYEMFSSKRPFEGVSHSEVLERIQTHDAPQLTHENPLLQSTFENIVETMLEKDPSRRYTTISEVIVDLERAMEHFELKRDRRRLQRYMRDPEGYTKAFNEKLVARCLAQGTYFMQKGKTHLADAIQEFRRILYLDPTNERARKHLAKIIAKHGDGTSTVTLDRRNAKSSANPSPGRRVTDRKERPIRAEKRMAPPSRTARKWIVAPFLVFVVALAAFGGWRGWMAFMSSRSVNTAPVVSSPSRLTVTEGERIEFSLNVIDSEGDSVRLYSKNLPKGAVLTPAGEFSWQVEYDQDGQHEVSFFADDGTKVGRTQTVIEVVNKPVELDFKEVRRTSTEVGKPVKVTLQAAGAVGGVVDFSLEDPPKGMKVNGDRVSWTPAETQTGTFRVPVRGSDGVAEAERMLVVDVRAKKKAEPKTGRLDWVLPRSANIYVDGTLRVSEDTDLSIDVPAGKHTVRAEFLDGITSFEEVVNVRGGSRVTLDPPKITFGTMSVYFLGGVGELIINGTRFKEQPPFSGIVIPAGTYRVRCEMFREEDSREFHVAVKEGEETVIEYEIGSEPNIAYE